jgi:hypothetical protein
VFYRYALVLCEVVGVVVCVLKELWCVLTPTNLYHLQTSFKMLPNTHQLYLKNLEPELKGAFNALPQDHPAVQRLGAALTPVDALLKQDPVSFEEYGHQTWALMMAEDPSCVDEVERIYTVKKLQKNNFEANKACLEVQNKTLDVCISKSFSFLMKAFTNQAKPFQTKYALVRLVAEQEEAEART